MSSYQELAAHLVAEIPITRLKRLLTTPPDDPETFTVGGGVCGNSCSGSTGSFCGIRCNPPTRAVDVIDREGRFAKTVDLKAVRQNLPQLREAVKGELAPHLDRLRAS